MNEASSRLSLKNQKIKKNPISSIFIAQNLVTPFFFFSLKERER